MTKYRKDLIYGKRDNSPCTLCNAEGTVLGKNHANNWKKFIQKIYNESNFNNRSW